jgi:nitrile hydratase
VELHDTSSPSPSAGRYPASDAVLASRVRALEALLIEKGLLGADTVDAIVGANEADLGPLLGARLVARSWLDPDFKARFLADATAALLEYTGADGQDHETSIAVVENTDDVHHVVVCTLCSCYPWEVMGLPPAWYKSAEYRSRVVIEPRKVLADDFGFEVPRDVEIRVVDSTAELRWFVMPRRPEGTEHLGEDDLAALVTRDGLTGVAPV